MTMPKREDASRIDSFLQVSGVPRCAACCQIIKFLAEMGHPANVSTRVTYLLLLCFEEGMSGQPEM